jgi:hypothetical protein
MSFLFKSLLFDFKEIKIEQLKNNNDSISIDKALEKFVDELNKKINNKSLIFEYDYDINTKTLYLTLKIDTKKILNILRAKIEIKNEQKYKIISFSEIVWMYYLSEKFMNNIFKEEKSLLSPKKDYFYVIMSKYYDVVDIQMDIYLNTINKEKSKYNYYEIISIFNFIVSNGYCKKHIEEYIEEYMICIKNININNSNILDYENSYRKFITIIFLCLIEHKNTEKEINDINISYDLDFFIFFYILPTYTTTHTTTHIDESNNKENLKKKYFTRDFTKKLDITKINNGYKTQMNRGFMNIYVDGKINNNFKSIGAAKKGIFFKDKYLDGNDNIINEIIRIIVNCDTLQDYILSCLFQKYILKFSSYILENDKKKSSYFSENKKIFGMNGSFNIINQNDFNRIDEYKQTKNIKNIEDKNIDDIKSEYGINIFKLKYDGRLNFLKRKISFNINTTFLGYYLGFFISVNIIFTKNNYSSLLLNFFIEIVSIFGEKILNYKINKFTRKNPKLEYSKYLIKLLECLGNIDIKILNQYITNENQKSLINFINFFFSPYGVIKDDKMDLAFKILLESTKYIVDNNTFLIISYNEENKDYDFIDCIPILYRVFTCPPIFIVLGTQESTSKVTKEGLNVLAEATHYPHVLGSYLTQFSYTYDNMKESGHKIKVKDKNVRMRIFFYEPKNNNEKIPQIVINKEKKLAEINTINSYLNSSKFSFKNLNTYFKTFYRGAIFFKIIVKINGEEDKKFIFVNAHLYFDETNQSEKKYKGRNQKFIDLITKPVFNADKDNKDNKMNLIQLYDAGYNIFIFGDLCFSNIDLNKFLTNPNKSNSKEQISNFTNILFKSIDNNTPTTYKYNTTNYNSRKKNINSELNKYTPDRILYALTSIKPNPKKLDTYPFPYKSKHLMVSLLLGLFPTTRTVS